MQRSVFFAKTMRKLKIIESGLLKGFNFYLTKRINKKAFKIPVIRNMGWNNIFDNEPWMGQLVEIILNQKDGIFIDVGANIGQTLLKVKSIEPLIPYYAFELNPACLFYLQELVKANDFLNIHIIPAGLSDKSGLGFLCFYSGYPDDATASVKEEIRPGNPILRKEYVFLTRIDEVLNTLGENISVIKIDVEGSEPEVLNGAIHIIHEKKPFIIVEILPVYSQSNSWRLKRLIQTENLIKDLNYEIFRIKKINKNILKGIEKIETIGIGSDISDRDFLLVPKELNFSFDVQ